MESDVFESNHHGQIVRYYRKRQKWSRLKLAQELGVDESTIYRLEKRTTIRDLQKRYALVALLGIPTSLLAVSEPPPLLKKSSSLVFNADHMAFLENQLTIHWDMYRTGGTLYVASGLDHFLGEIEKFVCEAKDTHWQERARTICCFAYQLQGCIFSDLMRYHQAHRAYHTAIDIAKEADDCELLASALARQGVTYIQQNLATKALSCLNTALELVHGQGLPALRGYILKALSETYACLQQQAQSMRTIEQAERTLEAPDKVSERSHCRFNKASIFAQKGINAVLLHDYERAIMLIDKSLVTYDPTIIRGRARLLAQKAQAYYGLNDLWGCTTIAEEASRLAGAVGSMRNIERLRALQQALLQSRWRKEASVIHLGIVLAEQECKLLE